MVEEPTEFSQTLKNVLKVWDDEVKAHAGIVKLTDENRSTMNKAKKERYVLIAKYKNANFCSLTSKALDEIMGVCHK